MIFYQTPCQPNSRPRRGFFGFISKKTFAALLIVFGVFYLFGAQPAQAQAQSLQVGRKAPDFALPDLEGKQRRLYALTEKTKASLILIWGVWCPYCREIMVKLKGSYEQFHKQGLEIIAVSIRESPLKVSLFVNKLKPDFVVLVDEWAELKQSYHVKDVPRVVIVDRNCIVQATAITTSVKKINALIKKAISD